MSVAAIHAPLVRLSDMALSVTDGDHQAPPKANEGIPFLTISAINDERVSIDKASRFVPATYFNNLKPERKPASGDVLFSVTGSIAIAALVSDERPFTFQRHIAIIKPDPSKVLSRYLWHSLRTQSVKDQARAVATGTAQLTIPLGGLRNLTIPLPGLEEQHRIVAKLDSLLARSARGRHELDRVPKLIERYKQAILAKAFSGELTVEWRQANNLPLAATVTLESMADGFSYGSSAKSSAEGRIPVLRMGNIQDGRLNWADLVFTSDQSEIDKYRLSAGDVLFNRTNSPALVGKTALYCGEREAIYAGYLIRVRCSARLLPQYLTYCLNSPEGRDYCWQVKTDGVSQSNVNAKKLAAFEFRVPEVEEQREIVRRIEIAITWLDKIATEHARADRLLPMLDQSILAKAFRGELVPQDPSDEPAPALLNGLERMRYRTHRGNDNDKTD